MNLRHKKSTYFVTPETIADPPTRNLFIEWSSKLFKAFQDIYDDLNQFRTAIGGTSFGDESVDGSWRMVKSGNNLAIQRREAGSWVTKQLITP